MTKKGDKVSTRRSRRQAGIAPTPAVTNRKKKKTAPQDKSQRRHEAEEESAQEEEAEHRGTEVNGEDDMEDDDEYLEDVTLQYNGEAQEDGTQPQEECNVPQEEIMQEEDTQPSNGEAQDAETVTKKRTRGLTKMRGVAKQPEEKVDVEFTSLGEHVGKGSVTLSSFLGPLVREHVPVLLDDWRHLDDKTGYVLWEEIQVLYM